MNVHFPKMDVKIGLPACRCSNQGLTGELDTSFPNELSSVLRWTSKHDSAGRLRWTSNRAKLPLCWVGLTQLCHGIKYPGETRNDSRPNGHQTASPHSSPLRHP